MTTDKRRWVVMIQEVGWWRVLASYPSWIEARRCTSATRADGTPTKILRDGDPRIERLQLQRYPISEGKGG